MRRRLGLVALLLLLVTTAAMAAPHLKQTTLPMQTRPGGEYSFPAITVPTDVVGLMFTMDISEATGSLPLIECSLEGSVDGGTNWGPAGAFTRTAGPKVNDKQGVLQTTTGATFMGGDFWSNTGNPLRRLRGKAKIGGSLRFALEVTPL